MGADLCAAIERGVAGGAWVVGFLAILGAGLAVAVAAWTAVILGVAWWMDRRPQRSGGGDA